MKKVIFHITMLLGVVIMSLSCSSDDDSSASLNTSEEKMIGEWDVIAYGYINNGNDEITPINTSCYNRYTFNTDKTINYKNYYPGDCSLDEENGTWNMEGAILTRTFPEDVELIMTDSIVFVSVSKIKVFDIDDDENFTVYEKSN